MSHTAAIRLPPATAVEKVVLLRPASLTHHADMTQQYVELPILAHDPGTVTFRAPEGPPDFANPPSLAGPPGYWLLFLVSTGGAYSEGVFVHLP